MLLLLSPEAFALRATAVLFEISPFAFVLLAFENAPTDVLPLSEFWPALPVVPPLAFEFLPIAVALIPLALELAPIAVAPTAAAPLAAVVELFPQVVLRAAPLSLPLAFAPVPLLAHCTAIAGVAVQRMGAASMAIADTEPNRPLRMVNLFIETSLSRCSHRIGQGSGPSQQHIRIFARE